MGDTGAIHPNAMSFDETLELLRRGTLEMLVDQGMAIVAVRSGVPLSPAGKMANLLMAAAPVIGLVLALTFSWWWLLVGVAACFGNFRLARAECVKAVRREAFKNERLFYLLRDQGYIRFVFARD